MAHVFRPWLLALRPKTLTAAVVPVAVGTALAAALGGTWSAQVMVFALLGALFIQIGTNLFNDAIDFKKGADTAERLGPVRVTQSGLLGPRTVMWGGVIAFVLATLCGLPLVIKGGTPIVVIGLLSLLMGYAYTGGPWPLAYRGWGDVFVVLFFGLVAVGGVFYLHTGIYDPDAMVAGIQVGFLATTLIAINNLRDYRQDAQAGKLTLAVRFGPRFACYEILFLYIGTFALSLWWVDRGLFWVALLPLVSLPRVFVLVRSIWKSEPGRQFNGFLAQAAVVQMLFGACLVVGFLLKGVR